MTCRSVPDPFDTFFHDTPVTFDDKIAVMFGILEHRIHVVLNGR